MFRRATASDRDLLDEMTLAGARYWGHDVQHPAAYSGLVAQLQAEDGPEHHTVFVLEKAGEVTGFYELRDRDDYVELVRMFVRTDLIGHGHGRVLWDHAVEQGARTHNRMLIMSDPGAVGFYSAVGAKLERSQVVAPGFSLGVFWQNLRPA